MLQDCCRFVVQQFHNNPQRIEADCVRKCVRAREQTFWFFLRNQNDHLKFMNQNRRQLFICLFTNDKGRLAPLTCHTVRQTLKSLSIRVNTISEKIRHKNSYTYQIKQNTQQHYVRDLLMQWGQMYVICIDMSLGTATSPRSYVPLPVYSQNDYEKYESYENYRTALFIRSFTHKTLLVGFPSFCTVRRLNVFSGISAHIEIVYFIYSTNSVTPRFRSYEYFLVCRFVEKRTLNTVTIRPQYAGEGQYTILVRSTSELRSDF